jgi:hypothetical protein
VKAAVRETLYLAALLAGEGAGAETIADLGAAAVAAPLGRSCIDAGAPLQLTLDAPGPAGLRFGLPVSDAGAMLPESAAHGARETLARLTPPTFAPPHPLGTWVFRGPAGDSVHADIRDGSPRAALARVRPLLGGEGPSRLEGVGRVLEGAEPWTLGFGVGEQSTTKRLGLRPYRERDPRVLAERLGLSALFDRATPLLTALLGAPPSARHQPWLLSLPLEGARGPELRLGTSLWARRADDEAKRKTLRAAISLQGGDAGHAEALLSMLRGRVPAGVRWSVLRAFEVHVTEERVLLRVIFVPWLEAGASALEAGASALEAGASALEAGASARGAPESAGRAPGASCTV